MAIVTRYFSTTSDGYADGTTWDDRAVLFESVWSTVITGFDFGVGSDSLLCLIGPGSYAITATLASTTTDANPIMFHGCDSSGIPLTPPDPDWNSAMPDWDDSGLPVLSTTTNIFVFNINPSFAKLLKFTASGITASPINNNTSYDWCSLVQNTNNTSARAIAANPYANNCIVSMTGANYFAGVVGFNDRTCFNIRVTGNKGSGGNMNGFDQGNTSGSQFIQCTSIGNGGNGIGSTATSAAAFGSVRSCSCIDNAGNGIELFSTASQTFQHMISDCLCAGNTLFGIDISASNCWLSNNRTRDNGSGDTTGNANYEKFGHNEESVLTDATEFVDSAGGDYRITSTAATWGQGFGAGDGPAASGGSGVSPGGDASNYMEDQVADYIFRAGYAFQTDNVYLALYTSNPDENNTGAEVSGNAYARQLISFGASVDGTMTSDAAIVFPKATGSWGTITHFAIFDSETAGNMLVYSEIYPNTTIVDNEQLTANSLQIIID